MELRRVNFSLKERRRLNKAGINFKQLNEHSYTEIFEALQVSAEREFEIRKILDKDNVSFDWAIPFERTLNHSTRAISFVSQPIELHPNDSLNWIVPEKGVITQLLDPMTPNWATISRLSVDPIEHIHRPLTTNNFFSSAAELGYPMAVESNVYTAPSWMHSPITQANQIFADVYAPSFTGIANAATIQTVPHTLFDQFVHVSPTTTNGTSAWSTGGLFGSNDAILTAGSSVTNSLGTPYLSSGAIGWDGVLDAISHPVTGSLIEMPAYKSLGIGMIANDSLWASPFERTYTNIGATLTNATLLTQLAESDLSQFSWSTLGSRLDTPEVYTKNASAGFLNFSESYRDVLRSVSARPNWVYEAPITAGLPSLDYYTTAGILRVVSDETAIDEVAEKVEELNDATRDVLLEYLPQLDKDLPMMWHGAVQALRSNNVDKIRHFITSLRELFTHVLHLMATDRNIEAWDPDRVHYDHGRPTRRGRFLYICRGMAGSDKAFSKFIQNDIESVLTLIGLFQSGTHKIRSDFSPRELELIRIRAEISLRTFLTIEFEINR